MMWCALFRARELHLLLRLIQLNVLLLSTGVWRGTQILCPLPLLLSFLQLLVDRCLMLSTVKIYVAAISSCHKGVGERSFYAHQLVKRFLKGMSRQRPVTRPLAPQWDLALVSCSLGSPPFEPLDQLSLKFL